MSERKPQKRNPSRTAVIAVVVVLIVIAIAGIVLATRKPGAAPEAGPAPQARAPVPVRAAPSTPAGASAPTSAVPNEIVFLPGSDKLPAQAPEAIARFADAARAAGKSVRLSARFLTGEKKARDLELAKARTAVIQQAVVAAGLTTDKMQIELIEVPPPLADRDANRVDLILR
jgi:hypothetical protein